MDWMILCRRSRATPDHLEERLDRMDEDVVTGSTVGFPVDRNEDLSAPRKPDKLSDELNDKDPCRSRIEITDDRNIRLLSVRFPINDFRMSRRSDDL
jgi:hypothetical protein